jgi:peptide/nickel transport system permease protein
VTEFTSDSALNHLAENRKTGRFFQRWQNVLGVILILVFVIIAISADWITPSSDMYWAGELTWENDIYKVKPHPPAPETPLGTLPTRVNARQIDIFTALVHGSRTAMKFGLLAALITGIFGVIVGTTAGWYGGWINDTLMRISDALLALPVLVGVVVLQQVISVISGEGYRFWYFVESWKPISPISSLVASFLTRIDPTLIAIILFSWMPYARMSNNIVLRNKQLGYIQASKSLGASSLRIMFKHLIPNSISPTVVLLSKDIGSFVLLQAYFTFIGLKSTSEWGEVMVYARDYLVGLGGNFVSNWWVFLPITLALILFSVGWNLLGDGLNDMLNPRTR